MSAVVKVQHCGECDVNTACSETLWSTAQVQHKEAIAVHWNWLYSYPQKSRQCPPQNRLRAHGKGYMWKGSCGVFDVSDCPKSSLSKLALDPCVLLQYRKYTMRVISVCMFNATLPLFSLKWDRSLCAVAQAELINTHIQYWSPHIHERLWKKAHHCSASFTRDSRC